MFLFLIVTFGPTNIKICYYFKINFCSVLIQLVKIVLKLKLQVLPFNIIFKTQLSLVVMTQTFSDFLFRLHVQNVHLL